MQTVFKAGDRLYHSNRPEWGQAVVVSAEPTTHEGKKCQRLTLRFERAGLKTLSTGIAPLAKFEQASTAFLTAVANAEHQEGYIGTGMGTSLSRSGSGEHDVLAAKVQAAANGDLKAMLVELPDAVTDPFSTPKRRLEATLSQYRFTSHGGSLLDWAAAQTKLKDPLSHFSRQDLEDSFRRFSNKLEAHLKTLLREVRKQDPAGLAEVARTASPAGQQAMRRADSDR